MAEDTTPCWAWSIGILEKKSQFTTYFLRFSRVGTLERNCHIPDIFYNTVLVDRVCRHVAIKVQTVGPFDLHHSVLKKEIWGNWGSSQVLSGLVLPYQVPIALLVEFWWRVFLRCQCPGGIRRCIWGWLGAPQWGGELSTRIDTRPQTAPGKAPNVHSNPRRTRLETNTRDWGHRFCLPTHTTILTF